MIINRMQKQKKNREQREWYRIWRKSKREGKKKINAYNNSRSNRTKKMFFSGDLIYRRSKFRGKNSAEKEIKKKKLKKLKAIELD